MVQDRVVLGLVVAGAIFGAAYYVSGHLPASVAATSQLATKHVSHTDHSEKPDEVVRAFYSAINDRRYADAYALLSSSFRRQTSLAQFSGGYRTTRHVSVDVDATSGGVVGATIHAADDDSDGAIRERTFRGQWKLTNEGDRWRLSQGSFSTIADSHSPQLVSAEVTSPLTAGDRENSDAAPISGCRMLTDDKFLDHDFGELADDSALEDFGKDAAALDLAARERIGKRYEDVSPRPGLRDALFKQLVLSCRFGETLQHGTAYGMSSAFFHSRANASDAEIKFFVALDMAEYAVELRGLADPALLAEAYAPFEPEIPLKSVEGSYHPIRWPPDLNL